MIVVEDPGSQGARQPLREEWKPLTEAAKEIGVSHAKLSRMAKAQRIKSKIDPFDERRRLVDMIELRRIFQR